MDASSAAWEAFELVKGGGHDDEEEDPISDREDCSVCPFCGSIEVLLRDGMFECGACHALVDRFLDHSAEWRFYGFEDSKATDPTRCSPPANELIAGGSGTIMTSNGRESYGMRMIRKYQMWNSMTYRERVLYNIFDTLTVRACQNSIPNSILDEAKVLYKKATDNRISRGENREALIACSIYVSCKTNKVPRSVKEIADMFHLKLPAMTRGCKLYQEILDVHLQCSKPEDFVNRFCSRLNLDKSAVETCKHVVRKADELSLVCESTPPSVVAGALHMCNVHLRLGIAKKDLCGVCQVSQVTINKCHRKLAPHARELFPSHVVLVSQPKKK